MRFLSLLIIHGALTAIALEATSFYAEVLDGLFGQGTASLMGCLIQA